jgi:hypothetical protein
MDNQLTELPLLTVSLQAATHMSGLSRSTLLRRADEGLLETRNVCGRRLVVVASLRKLLGLDSPEGQEAA